LRKFNFSFLIRYCLRFIEISFLLSLRVDPARLFLVLFLGVQKKNKSELAGSAGTCEEQEAL
jgi:hypothetical protein